MVHFDGKQRSSHSVFQWDSGLFNKKVVLLQGNRAMPQLFFLA